MSVRTRDWNFDITSTLSCLQKDSPNETVGMSGETPKLRNTKTQSLVGCNTEEFTARVVAIETFFMSEIYELKPKFRITKTEGLL